MARRLGENVGLPLKEMGDLIHQNMEKASYSVNFLPQASPVRVILYNLKKAKE